MRNQWGNEEEAVRVTKRGAPWVFPSLGDVGLTQWLYCSRKLRCQAPALRKCRNFSPLSSSGALSLPQPPWHLNPPFRSSQLVQMACYCIGRVTPVSEKVSGNIKCWLMFPFPLMMPQTPWLYFSLKSSWVRVCSNLNQALRWQNIKKETPALGISSQLFCDSCEQPRAAHLAEPHPSVKPSLWLE